MKTSAQISSALLLSLYGTLGSGRVVESRDLRIPHPSEYNYTIEHPFAVPPKPNGLDVEQPNMILFMPDQLRFDSVGTFGNDVSCCRMIDGLPGGSSTLV